MMRISTVKLVFSFCANAKFNDIACIVAHHYHVFHVPRRFYSVNKSCSIIFQLHMITELYCISNDPLTPPRGRLTGVKLG